MKSLFLVCLLVVTLTVAIAAPAEERSGTARKQKKKNCVMEPDTPQRKCNQGAGVFGLLDNSDGHAAGVLERFNQMGQQLACRVLKEGGRLFSPGAYNSLEKQAQDQVERKKRSWDMLGSRTPLSGKNNDHQASAVWKRIHSKTQYQTTADPVLI